MVQPTIRELLIREEKARKQIIAPLLSNLGLTPGQGQGSILMKLLQEDRITQKELSDRCRLDVATMSRNIDKLGDMGFLTRELNPNCRRSFLICLTEKGRVEAHKIKDVFHQFDTVICQNIAEEDLAAFRSVLTQICDNLDSYKDSCES
ncbi:MarR family winged helix-turn-helix transcriptional regulator [Scatolibacter rhodanostii]|uniref:MarR family winged helix-turn-helix transcriptional regulator n=1 Tax=Scatolibacter rhodanostii TaxID=2014781 RepID=UPI000C08AE43|nr:MarR family transcriptional regulator [Scatolibacter rhodanostii]